MSLCGNVGKQGEQGFTPYIGSNGNWWINGEDTGKPSRGLQGLQGLQGKEGSKGEKGEKGDTLVNLSLHIDENGHLIATINEGGLK